MSSMSLRTTAWSSRPWHCSTCKHLNRDVSLLKCENCGAACKDRKSLFRSRPKGEQGLLSTSEEPSMITQGLLITEHHERESSPQPHSPHRSSNPSSPPRKTDDSGMVVGNASPHSPPRSTTRHHHHRPLFPLGKTDDSGTVASTMVVGNQGRRRETTEKETMDKTDDRVEKKEPRVAYGQEMPSTPLEPAPFKSSEMVIGNRARKPKTDVEIDVAKTSGSGESASNATKSMVVGNLTNKPRDETESNAADTVSHVEKQVTPVAATQLVEKEHPRAYAVDSRGTIDQHATKEPQQPGIARPGAYKVGGREQSTGEVSFASDKDGSTKGDTATVVATVISESELEQDIRLRLLKEHEDEQVALEELRQRIFKEAVQAEVLPSNKSCSESSFASTTSGGKHSLAHAVRPANIKEQLFGDARVSNVDVASSPEVIQTRTLLPWSVYENKTTKAWILSVQTNQKALDTQEAAAKSCITYSFSSRYEARRAALQLAPPQMLPQAETCHICRTKFAVFRRQAHCRNCGVCVCSVCCKTWPAKMVPETYNTKNAASLNVCLACDWLSMSFRTTLVEGNHDKVLNLYDTGNINLRTPFDNVKGEVLYPIHCAAMSGNLNLLKWLVDQHRCPVQYTPNSSRSVSGKHKKSGPVVTSKGRSVLGIALTTKQIPMIQYLVSVKKMSLYEEKDLDMNVALANFATVLNLLQEKQEEEESSARPAVDSSYDSESELGHF